MTPRRLDVDIVARRMRALSDALDGLRRLAPVSVATLGADPVRRAAAERLAQVSIDLAIEVNAHLAVSRLGRAPTSGRESFLLAGEAGAVEPDLAVRLAPAAGFRNVLVHNYVDVRLDLLAEAITRLLRDLPEYVRQVAGFVATHADRDGSDARGGSA